MQRACVICGHVWVPNRPTPQVCPRCKRRGWRGDAPGTTRVGRKPSIQWDPATGTRSAPGVNPVLDAWYQDATPEAWPVTEAAE